mmetsp:Transcript_21789/g.40682  ORF Transcript_21789/g.40682 Transcript_21789/m.40682 type:complete len:435 (-) Transcript_21789:249-1553(-)
MYMEEHNLPFECADCWVPSMSNHLQTQDDEPVRLLSAGFVTRDDQDKDLTASLLAFGEYSKSFSFRPGRGLPGRVYVSGKSAWQLSLNETHPNTFARAGGAKLYGLKTALAMPFASPGVGRMIVVMYSTRAISEDSALVEQCLAGLSRYSPQPKWKLVIEVGPNPESKVSPAGIEKLHEARVDPNTATESGSSSSTSNVHNGSSDFNQSTGHPESPKFESCDDDDDIEKRLITLLADQLPSLHSTPSGQPSSSVAGDNKEIVGDIIRMRLLLLRPASKRTDDNNDVIALIKNSFKNYTAKGNRSDSEIVMLLAREWQCLQSLSPSIHSQTPAATPSPRLEGAKLPDAIAAAAPAAPGLYPRHGLDLESSCTAAVPPPPITSHALRLPSFPFRPIAHTSAPMDSYDHSRSFLPSADEIFNFSRNISVDGNGSSII